MTDYAFNIDDNTTATIVDAGMVLVSQGRSDLADRIETIVAYLEGKGFQVSDELEGLLEDVIGDREDVLVDLEALTEGLTGAR